MYEYAFSEMRVQDSEACTIMGLYRPPSVPMEAYIYVYIYIYMCTSTTIVWTSACKDAFCKPKTPEHAAYRILIFGFPYIYTGG